METNAGRFESHVNGPYHLNLAAPFWHPIWKVLESTHSDCTLASTPPPTPDENKQENPFSVDH
jgi:hypothetical protein